MTDVFLSYASEDEERAGRLASSLQTRGWSVWWDRKIIAGQAYDQVIEQQLEAARCVVVLWSKDSVSSEWVKNEAVVASDRGVLVPVLIDEVRLPLEFRRKQTVSLVGWDGEQEHPALAELAQHITSKIKGTPLAQVTPRRGSVLTRRGAWILAGGFLVAAVLAVGTYWANTRRAQDPVPAGDTQQAASVFRRIPSTLSASMVEVLLQEHGFYDKNRNPAGKGVVNRYEPQIRSGAVVLFDDATGLMWQKGGSGPMTFDDTEDYVHRLNGERFAGFDDWRVPTLEEALSLMEPQAVNDRHIDPMFERDVNFIWTSDHTTDDRLWMIYFYDGIVDAERNSFNAWIRVVR